MNFPNILYRCPGPHQCKGGTFEYTGVSNEGQLEAAKKLGWFETLESAIAGKEPKKEEPVEIIAKEIIEPEKVIEKAPEKKPVKKSVKKRSSRKKTSYKRVIE